MYACLWIDFTKSRPCFVSALAALCTLWWTVCCLILLCWSSDDTPSCTRQVKNWLTLNREEHQHLHILLGPENSMFAKCSFDVYNYFPLLFSSWSHFTLDSFPSHFLSNSPYLLPWSALDFVFKFTFMCDFSLETKRPLLYLLGVHGANEAHRLKLGSDYRSFRPI